FNAVATTLQDSGWYVLGWDHIRQRLVIQQLTDEQGNISINITPLLVLDMWEHAFYLQYKDVKPDYVKAWWHGVDWEEVAQRDVAATGCASGRPRSCDGPCALRAGAVARLGGSTAAAERGLRAALIVALGHWGCHRPSTPVLIPRRKDIARGHQGCLRHRHR